MTKIIYLLDPDTGALLGESIHPLDPVKSERAGKPVYALLNPSLATGKAPPPIPAGMEAVMLSGEWLTRPIPRPPVPDAPVTQAEPPEDAAPTRPSFDERQAALRGLVQEYLDSMARALGYDDIKTAVTYAEEPSVPKFQSEGRALRAWRSQVWAACYALLDRVRSGDAEEPTPESLAGLLPPFQFSPLSEPPLPPDAGTASPVPAEQPPA